MIAPLDRRATSADPTSNAHPRRGVTALGALLALLLAPLAPACGNSNTGALLAAEDACHQNSDCQAGLLCALGACRAMCQTAADCGAGGQCVDDGDVAVCQYAAEANTPCNTQADCPAPLACASDYRCRNRCTTANDCNEFGITGRVCATDAEGVQYCANPSDVNGSGVLDDAPPTGAPDTGVVEPVLDAATEASLSADANDTAVVSEDGGASEDASESANPDAADAACQGPECPLTCGPSLTLCTPDGGPAAPRDAGDAGDAGVTGPYCADTSADSANCGACGNVCPNGTLCSGGTCTSACGSHACPRYFVPTGAVVAWTAPATGSYRIEAWGGSGGNGGQGSSTFGGLAADVGGVFSLAKGEELSILVASAGVTGTTPAGGGSGGGGSFVVVAGTPPTALLVAGGGGGGSFVTDGTNASLTATGETGVDDGTGNPGGAGGMSGAGGENGNTGGGGGGGGFSSSGLPCDPSGGGAEGGGGSSFVSGGAGGSCDATASGGFGGGGGYDSYAGGGGGGYSGGGGGASDNGGGGGGSYVASSATDTFSYVQTTRGSGGVVITPL
jgi:hypothetical protein